MVSKGAGGMASRGFNQGVGAYFTLCGPISRRQSEPARIHHRVTPRNNPLDHKERLSKASYLFISPRAATPSLSFSRPSDPSSSAQAMPNPPRYPLRLGSARFSKPGECLLCRDMFIFLLENRGKFRGAVLPRNNVRQWMGAS